ERLAEPEANFSFAKLFRAVVKSGHIADTIEILKRTGVDERWRPLYEALEAIQADTPDYLRRVAPEVRTAAVEILHEIAPQLYPEEVSE
ncbi:MAG: hypothetical protein JOZ45_06530, partial [Acidobacteriaceae bacterium]|nr:hypothetical protein [Acidobacteriaceae bacterium]